MRCPTCGDTPHTFHEHETIPAKGRVERFWDEKNRLHVHDHTLYRTRYHCSNGHQFDQATMSRCPVFECDWNQRVEINPPLNPTR